MQLASDNYSGDGVAIKQKRYASGNFPRTYELGCKKKRKKSKEEKENIFLITFS